MNWLRKSTQTAAAGAAATGILIAAAMSASAAGQLPEVGTWIDHSGKGAVEIQPCGDRLCGRIVWLESLVNAEGKPLRDRYNPSPEKRNRPICGLSVLGNLQRLPEGGWDGGWIYDPNKGEAYDVAVQAVSPEKLQVVGYKGIKLFSRTFVWTRAEEGLPRCDAAPRSATGPAGAPPTVSGKTDSKDGAKVTPKTPASKTVSAKDSGSKPAGAKSTVGSAEAAEVPKLKSPPKPATPPQPPQKNLAPDAAD